MPARSCLFCGNPGSSDEHVLAQWISEFLSEGAFYNLNRDRGRRKTGMRTFGVKSRTPCERCNNEWMSRFEEGVRPILTPALRGEAVVLGSWREQTELARWAFKTALMLDRSSAPPNVTPDEHFRYLYDERVPPPSVQVGLGHYRPQRDDPDPLAVGFGAASLGVGDEVPPDLGAYRVTFSVGQIVCQVYGYRGVVKGDYELARSIEMYDRKGNVRIVDDAFRSIWPLGIAPVTWPPPVNFDTSGLRLLEPLPV